MKRTKLDLSPAYRATQREHEAALAAPQAFYLTDNGSAAEWEQMFSRGLPPDKARVRLMEARYLDWQARNRGKHDTGC